jgi:hypothetical protein
LHETEIPFNSGAIPITSAKRTLLDCAAAQLAPELLGPAARQALRRGLATRSELAPLVRRLATFGETLK